MLFLPCSEILLTYWLHKGHVLLLLLYHGLKVDIYFDAKSSIAFFTKCSLFLDIVHAAPALFTIYL